MRTAAWGIQNELDLAVCGKSLAIRDLRTPRTNKGRFPTAGLVPVSSNDCVHSDFNQYSLAASDSCNATWLERKSIIPRVLPGFDYFLASKMDNKAGIRELLAVPQPIAQVVVQLGDPIDFSAGFFEIVGHPAEAD